MQRSGRALDSQLQDPGSILYLFLFLAPKHEELHISWAWRMPTWRDEAQREKHGEMRPKGKKQARDKGKMSWAFFLFLLPAGPKKYWDGLHEKNKDGFSYAIEIHKKLKKYEFKLVENIM